MDKLKKYKILALSGWVIIFFGTIVFLINIFAAGTMEDISNGINDNIIKSANREVINLGSLLIGKVSKSDIIKYYDENAGKKIDQEIDGVIYFDGLGYEFDKNGILVKIFPRIVYFSHVIPPEKDRQ